MIDNIESMFGDVRILMNRLKKKEYIVRMESFQKENEEVISKIVGYVGESEDVNAASKEVAVELCDKVFEKFAKKGKIKSTEQIDINLFMIYYVFPAILLTQDANATTICDTIRDEWRIKFNNPEFGYMNYDQVCGSFNTKLFGIF